MTCIHIEQLLTFFPAGVLAQGAGPGPSLLADFGPRLLGWPLDGSLIAFLKRFCNRSDIRRQRDKENIRNCINTKEQQHYILNGLLLTKPVFSSKHTLFFSSFCFCLSSRATRRFSVLIRCSSSFLRRSSSCCSLSCRAFSSFSSHWVFLAAAMGQKNSYQCKILPKHCRTKKIPSRFCPLVLL